MAAPANLEVMESHSLSEGDAELDSVADGKSSASLPRKKKGREGRKGYRVLDDAEMIMGRRGGIGRGETGKRD